MSKSTPTIPARKATSKPAKPHRDFPLFAHANGSWAKKVKGKLHYFGQWADPQGALERWLAVKDDLLAGRTPRVSRDGLTIRDLANRFLSVKLAAVDTGELSPRTFRDSKDICNLIVAEFGKDRRVDDLASDDFEAFRKHLAKTRGPVSLGCTVQRIRSVFKYGYDAGLIDKPVRFGPGFRKPTAKSVRQDKQARQRANGKRLFTRAEVHALLAAAGPQLRGMMLLGLNCGFGPADCGTLPIDAVDLEAGWIDFPRAKTAIPRRIPLWPETVEAIREALASRPKPKTDEAKDLLFVRKRGLSWHKDTPDSPISKDMATLMQALGIHKTGRGFYALRHVHRTLTDECGDQRAANAIMGHVETHMSAHYVEEVSDERLRRVVEHVRAWLYDEPADA